MKIILFKYSAKTLMKGHRLEGNKRFTQRLTACSVLTGFSFSSIPNFQTLQLSHFRWCVTASLHLIKASITFSHLNYCEIRVVFPGLGWTQAEPTFSGDQSQRHLHLWCALFTHRAPACLVKLVKRSHRLKLQFNSCIVSLKPVPNPLRWNRE